MRKTDGMKWGKKSQIRQIPGREGKRLSSQREKIARLVFWYLTLILLGWGTLQIYGDVFSLGESQKVCRIFLMVLSVGLVAGYEIFAEKKMWNRILLLGFTGWGILRFRQITAGITIIVNEIIHFMNDYYTVHIPDISIGVGTVKTAVEVSLFLEGLLLWQMSYALFRKRNRLFALLPGAFLFLGELLIGYAPGMQGIVCYLMGACGVQAWCVNAKSEKKVQMVAERIKGAGILAVALLLIFAAVSVVGEDLANSLVAKQGRALAYQHYLERSIVNWKGFSYFGGESGKVNNHTPLYLEKEVLEVTTSKKVKDHLYLRGYVGDSYQNGNWKNKSKALFSEEDWGKENSEDVGFEILNQLYDGQKENAEPSDCGTYTISYVAPGNQYAYLPYYTDGESVREELSISGDGMLFREKQNEISVDGLYFQTLSTILENGEQQVETSVEQEYEDYLEFYLEVPEGLTKLDALGTELSEQMEDFDAEENSLLRTYAAICLVRNAVNERVTYQKNLEQIPAGEDVVEYFLFETGEGYCTHYASAGVLLFRELGVPARYVTGYVVGEDDFKANGKGAYTAEVLDSDAHAWVEIYISGIGWVPIEMITGFDSRLDAMCLLNGTDGNYGILLENSSSDRQIYAINSSLESAGIEDWFESVTGESFSGKKAGKEQDIADTQEPSEMMQTEERTEGQSQKETVTNSEAGQETKTVTKSEGKKDDSTTEKNTTVIVMISCVGGTLFLILFWVAMCYGRKKKILDSFYQKNFRKAIQSITTQMYRVLKKKGVFSERNIDDSAFIEGLMTQKELFSEEEVNKLREVMEQAAFSQNAILKQDVHYCRKMYRKLLK